MISLWVLATSGYGEVQTPLHVTGEDAKFLAPGDPLFFRPAKVSLHCTETWLMLNRRPPPLFTFSPGGGDSGAF